MNRGGRPPRYYGRPRKLSPEQVAAVRAWAATGRSLAAVARNLGVAPNTLRRYLDGGHKERRA